VKQNQNEIKRYWSPTTGKVHATLECAALLRGKIAAQNVGGKFMHLPKCAKCYTKKFCAPTLTDEAKVAIARQVRLEMPDLGFLDMQDEIMRRIDFAVA
jgi:hypothetical protein